MHMYIWPTHTQIPSTCHSHLCWPPSCCLPAPDLWNLQPSHARAGAQPRTVRLPTHRCYGGVLHHVSSKDSAVYMWWYNCKYTCLFGGQYWLYLIACISGEFGFMSLTYQPLCRRGSQVHTTVHVRWHVGWGACTKPSSHWKPYQWRVWWGYGLMRHCVSSRTVWYMTKNEHGLMRMLIWLLSNISPIWTPRYMS